MNDLNEAETNLKNTPKILKSFVEKIPLEKIEVIRKKGVWSIYKHLLHLVETQNLLLNRLKIFKKEDNPVLKPYFPDDNEEKKEYSNMNEILDEFQKLRNKQLEIIDSYTIKDFKKKAEHNQYSLYNLEILIRHILMHDYWHMYRMEDVWLTRDEYIDEL